MKRNFLILEKDKSNLEENEFWEWRTCPICKKTFYVRKKYKKICCSNSCTLKYQEIHKAELNKKRSESLKKTNSKKTLEEKREELKKARETCLKLYGVDMYQKTQEYKDKQSARLKEIDWSERNKKIKKELEEKYAQICKDDNLEILEFNGRFDCKVKCLKCGHVFDIHVLGYLTEKTNHNLCRHCHPNINPTGETYPLLKVEEFLKSHSIAYIKNSRNLIYPYEIDLYIPNKNIGIEINGLYWHSETDGRKDKKYHINKTLMAQDKGIKLIHILEDEIVNKWEIVKSRLLNLLGLTPNLIYARKCTVKEISAAVKKKFLNENHIDGDSVSSTNIGLFYNDKLVSVSTFGNRKISGHSQCELIRFATLLKTRVIGGFSKMFSYYLKTYSPQELITYADIRWSGICHDNMIYNKLFKFVGITQPNYFYMDKKKYILRLNRLNFTKQKLIKEGYDAEKTEWEIMKKRGFDRIWDCGNLKFIYNKNGD